MKLPLPAQDIIPHRNAMLLVDTLVESESGKGVVLTTLKSDCIATAGDGIISPLIPIELMAQAYAAIKGWEIRNAGKNFPVGYLVGVQKFQNLAQAQSGHQLRIEVKTVGEFEGFAVVDGTVSQGETTVAQGRIKLWVPEDDV